MTEAMQRIGTSDANGANPRDARARDPADWSSRLDGLIAMLSHDLRTPLSAISGWIFLLESGKLDGEAQKRAIAKIKASVDEQVQLIDDTLVISRAETGRVDIEPARISIRPLLSAAIDAVRSQAMAKGLEIDDSAADLDAEIDADAARLQRAIELLLAHAVKATPSGGRVGVAARAVPDRIELIVSDTGNGVAATDLPFVLDPFRTTAHGAPRSPRGAERGLLLAKALIAAHGGTLSLASDGPGAGEAFTIELPRPAAPAAGNDK